MKAKDKRIAELTLKIPQVTPEEAYRRCRQGAYIVDVRDAHEVYQGSPVSAVRISRAFLELLIEDHIADQAQPLLILCAGGLRALFAADNLQQLGYQDVHFITGGFDRWKKERIPFEVPTKPT